jgi:RND family efflux transporter MFP subunit
MDPANNKPVEAQRNNGIGAALFRHALLPLVVVGCGAALTFYLLNTSPEAKPRKRDPLAALVEIREVKAGPQKTLIRAMGEIVPAKEIDLKPRVSGEVVEIADDFIPGGHFFAGRRLLLVDPVDYQLMIRQLESEVDRVESDISVEMGNQRIAEKEYVMLNERVSPEEKALILRKPQLAKLQASLELARAKLGRARLDLQRTEITAPFNCVIGTTGANIGSRVNEATVLAHLIGSDVFWLRLTLPVEQLRWVALPGPGGEQGARVRILSQGSAGQEHGGIRHGRVLRLAASLEEQGRMAQLLVRVDDPLSRQERNRGKPRLLLGSFVSAVIEGETIDSAVAIDRAHIHEGNRVWLMDEQNRLEIREVEVAFRGRNEVIITNGLEEGARLITSTLATPIAGIPLRPAAQKTQSEMGGNNMSGADGEETNGS